MKKVDHWKYYAALEALQEQFAGDGIHIYNRGSRAWADPVQLGVQWASIGTVSPEKAAAFANRVLDAAMAAESFVYNGYLVDYGGGEA